MREGSSNGREKGKIRGPKKGWKNKERGDKKDSVER
jgi:hypothetical protein